MLAKLRENRRAFTLIELLVVMVVISVLALIIIPKFASQGQRSKEAALRSNLALLRRAVATYQADTGAYPANLTALAVTPSPAVTGYRGPYIEGGVVPTDPVSGSALSYTASTGVIASSATGNDSNGDAYSTY